MSLAITTSLSSSSSTSLAEVSTVHTTSHDIHTPDRLSWLYSLVGCAFILVEVIALWYFCWYRRKQYGPSSAGRYKCSSTDLMVIPEETTDLESACPTTALYVNTAFDEEVTIKEDEKIFDSYLDIKFIDESSIEGTPERTADTNRVLKTELKSWKQNKMEAKKLARAHDEVDKHMLSTRKTHLFEKDLLHKDITDNISKRTPTADEYLNRSQKRYAGWRAREKERLDRRYKGLYKTYMREFSDLNIDEETLKKARKKHAEEKERKEKGTDKNVQNKDVETNDKSDNEEEDEDEDKDIHTALLDFQKLHLGGRRRYSVATTSSQYLPGPDDKMRRKSTGTALPLEVVDNLRRSSLPLFNENVDEAEKDLVNARSSTPVDRQDVKTAGDDLPDKGRRGRRASLAVTSDLAHSKEMQGIVNKNRKGRRVSIAVPSEYSSSDTHSFNFSGRKWRRSSVDDTSLQMGARLSRRSSIPNIEIPMAYGN